jgi:hypothetical protein
MLCRLAYLLCSVTESLYEVCIEGLGLVRGLHSTDRLTGLEFRSLSGDTADSMQGNMDTCENKVLLFDSCLAGNLVTMLFGVLCVSDSDLEIFERDLLGLSTSSVHSADWIEISVSCKPPRVGAKKSGSSAPL